MPANSNFHLHISYKEWVDSLLKKSLSVQGGFLPFTACQSGLFKKIQIGGNGLWRTKKPEKKENGGSVSPAVEVQLPWRQFAADRLVTSLALSHISIFGVSGTNRKCPLFIIKPDAGRSMENGFFTLSRP